MDIHFNNGIKVDYTPLPKKNKTQTSKYCIFIKFVIYQNGLPVFQPYTISTGLNIEIADWSSGKIIGRGLKAKVADKRLDDYLLEAEKLLHELSLRTISSCSDLLAEIQANAKQRITGRAQRGMKQAKLSILKQHGYGDIMKRLFEERNLSKGRRRGYETGFKRLNEYFNNKIPPINTISDTDLEAFKAWFLKTHKSKSDSNGNGAVDYLSKIAAVFKYALRIKAITVSPLPPLFRGQWKDGNRKPLTEEECLAIIALDDSKLSMTQQVAKYCLLVQLLSGMGYGDMEEMTLDNLKYDNNECKHYIEKERNKTNVKFKVFLTDGALYAVNKLKELSGNDHKPFNLPTIDYSLRMYKEIGKAANVKTHITTYTMRHTFAVNFMENDGQLEDLQKILGHTNIKTTGIYGKISNKRLVRKTQELQQKSKMHQLPTINKKTILKAV
ncbi:MAG: tyrosine-type recombinase/integrase [Ferruginibacter sp.]